MMGVGLWTCQISENKTVNRCRYQLSSPPLTEGEGAYCFGVNTVVEVYANQLFSHDMSHDMIIPTKWVYAQQRLRSAWASAQSSQSSLYAQWVAKDPSFLHADSKDSDQTGRMPRVIWVFAWRLAILLVLSCRGSYQHSWQYSHHVSFYSAVLVHI